VAILLRGEVADRVVAEVLEGLLDRGPVPACEDGVEENVGSLDERLALSVE
jgi:hypothetical protein